MFLAALNIFCILGLVATLAPATRAENSQNIIKDKTLLFLPAQAFRPSSGPDWGLYIELDPDGKFTNLELFEHGIGECHGVYKLKGKSLSLNLKTCEQGDTDPSEKTEPEKHRDVVMTFSTETDSMIKLLTQPGLGPYRRDDRNDKPAKIKVEIKVDNVIEDTSSEVLFVYRDDLNSVPTK